MSTPPFGRLITAMVTPFAPDGSVDLEVTRHLARHLVDTGSDGLVVTGTTGESPTLSDEEKLALYHTVVDELRGRAAVIAGTGTNDTAHSVQLTKGAEQAGVDGILAVTPYYNRPSQEGLEAHFTAIEEATSLPVLLYNIPSRTGRLIEVATVLRLARHERIAGVKDSVGDVSHTTAVLAGAPSGFAVYSGDDAATLPLMAIGARGVVSVAAHVVGRQMKSMIEAYLDGKVEEAAVAHRKLAEVWRLLFVEPSPQPVKAALRLVGIDAGAPRLPLVEAQRSTIDALRSALAEL